MVHWKITARAMKPQGRNGKQKNRKLLKEDKDEIGGA